MVQILWVDDEIDLLKPHILFLAQSAEEAALHTGIADAGNLA